MADEEAHGRRNYLNDENLKIVVGGLEHQNDVLRDDVRRVDDRLRLHAEEERTLWEALKQRLSAIEQELIEVRPATQIFQGLSGVSWLIVWILRGLILIAAALGAYEVIKRWLL